MLDRITGMQVFSRAATGGSLSEAARHLRLSPGMATKHLNALEERLGARLFHRSTRKLTLTEPGQQYLELCARLLPELDEVEATIASLRAGASNPPCATRLSISRAWSSSRPRPERRSQTSSRWVEARC